MRIRWVYSLILHVQQADYITLTFFIRHPAGMFRHGPGDRCDEHALNDSPEATENRNCLFLVVDINLSLQVRGNKRYLRPGLAMQ